MKTSIKQQIRLSQFLEIFTGGIISILLLVAGFLLKESMNIVLSLCLCIMVLGFTFYKTIKKSYGDNENLQLAKNLLEEQEQIIQLGYILQIEGFYEDRGDPKINLTNLSEEIEDLKNKGVLKYKIYGGGMFKKVLLTKKGIKFYDYYFSDQEKEEYKTYRINLMKSKGYKGDGGIMDFEKIYQSCHHLYNENRKNDALQRKKMYQEMNYDTFLGFADMFYCYELHQS